MMKAFFVLLSGVLSSCAIEKPGYETVKKEGDFEVRKYESIRVVSAPMDGMEKRDQSFRKLFKYISGENAGKKKIAMTSPVFMEKAQSPDEKQKGSMSFMLPAEVAKAGPPSPDSDEVSLGQIDSGAFVVLRFKDWDNEKAQAAASEKLDQLISQHQLEPVGKKFFAFYDPPWTPGLLRTNEVWQRIRKSP